MFKKVLLILLLATVFLIPTLSLFAQGANGDVIESLDKYSGAIDWGEGKVSAKGYGAPPNKQISEGQKDILARRAAVVDAYRNLAEVVGEVRIDSETLVKDAAVESDQVKSQVKMLVKGARIMQETKLPNGNYEVVVGLKIAGKDGLTDVILPVSIIEGEILDPSSIQTESPVNYQTQGDYTGLIVDCRGLHVYSAMSPKILDPQGEVIYGNLKVTGEYALNSGIAGWLHTMEEAKDNVQRVGENPMIIKAIDKKGGEWPCNPVISAQDAVKLLQENEKAHFLEKCKVCFVIDPQYK